MKIEVKQEDVDNGSPREAHKCALAMAINRCLPDSVQATVGRTSVFYWEKSAVTGFFIDYVALPPEACVFRADFDANNLKGTPKPGPISFELPDSQKLINYLASGGSDASFKLR